MSNTVRHLLGVLLGAIAAPVTWLPLSLTLTPMMAVYARYFRFEVTGETIAGLASIVFVAVVLGLLTSVRWVSPLASLICGLIYFVFGIAYLVLSPSITGTMFDLLPKSAEQGTFTLGQLGVFALLGLLLIVSSTAPHRWRERPRGRRQYTGFPGAPDPRAAGPAQPNGGWGAPDDQPGARPYGGQPYGGQPYGGRPYGEQPYPDRPGGAAPGADGPV